MESECDLDVKLALTARAVAQSCRQDAKTRSARSVVTFHQMIYRLLSILVIFEKLICSTTLAISVLGGCGRSEEMKEFAKIVQVEE